MFSRRSRLSARPGPVLLRHALMLLGALGVCASLVIAYRGTRGQLPWNVTGGRGTDAEPYLVSTCQQLEDLSLAPAAAYALAGNIDCSDETGLPRGLSPEALPADRSRSEGLAKGEVPHARDEVGPAPRSSARSAVGFFPIAPSQRGFTGKLFGRGYAITHLVIRRPSGDAVGLFAKLGSGAIVRDFSLQADIAGRDDVGAVAGWSAGGVIDAVSLSGRVEGRKSVGGVVGINQGIIRNLATEATVEGIEWVGGIAGFNDEGGLIDRTVMSGTVNGQTDVGGIAGVSRGATINACTVTGDVQGQKDVGGAVGWLMGGDRQPSSVIEYHGGGRLRGAALASPIGTRGLPDSHP